TVGESDTIFAIDQHPNIEYRIYNPFGRRYDSIFLREVMNLGEFYRLDHRMHNKVLVADNRTAIIGGRNIADEYFGDHLTANFRDMEVLTAGPVVESISSRFDDYWNNNWSIPADRVLELSPPEKEPEGLMVRLKATIERGLEENHMTRRHMWLSAARSAAPGKASVIADDPAQQNPAAANELPNQLARALVEWIDRSNEELILVSAYLIPTPKLEAAIERAESRGVRVRILTNSLRSNNHVPAHSFYRNHVERLIGHGADLHEVRALAKDRSIYMRSPVDNKKLGLHAKLILFDRDHVFIGSTNLDPRSLHQNTEIGIFIQSAELNQRLREKLAIDFHKRNAWHLQIDDDGKIVWVADDIVLDSQPADQGKPFDIGDYQKTLVELSNSAQELTKLATTVERISSNTGVDELIPVVIKAMEEAQSESEKLTKYATRMILVLIGVWFVAYVIAKLLILFASKKMKSSDGSVSP
ncbi:MAG: hypothetical protein JRF29_03510, partial [Deltaproteobacteria bacterium]|nr:hypothetical protein [Deltaproteobacteria bacterium]